MITTTDRSTGSRNGIVSATADARSPGAITNNDIIAAAADALVPGGTAGSIECAAADARTWSPSDIVRARGDGGIDCFEGIVIARNESDDGSVAVTGTDH